MQAGPKVYSYLRFSDPKQASGHSADRQAQYAKAWAKERGLSLDESLTLRDEGLSAYHQRHIKQGALGVFLSAIEDGRIAPGSVLVVEGLDRLSRAEPIQAQAQLAQIIGGGVTVVTASDGREYNRERLKAQPMDLVYSLLVMIRAHEESDTKSKRVSAAIRRQCQGWIDGTYRGLIRNGGDPRWLQLQDGKWEFIQERARAVRFALDRYLEGLGGGRIYQLMVDGGYDTSNVGNGGERIYRLVRLPALKGAKQISVGGDEFTLPDYYPRLVSDSEFEALQVVNGERFRRRGKGVIPGVVTGIGITYCGYCGTSMSAQNVMQKRRTDGSMADGHRRIMCVSYMDGQGCDAGGSCSVAPVERAVMAYCSDQMNLQRLQEPALEGKSLMQMRIEAQGACDEIEGQISRLTEALALGEGEGVAPLVLVRKLQELEQRYQGAKAKVQEVDRKMVAATASQAPANAQVWADLAAGVDALDTVVRERVRQLMLDTFERIVIYMRGVIPAGRKSRDIDVLLVSKAGQKRWLRVDRKTSNWAAGADRPS
ncbi:MULTISPECIES: recombinase family protein [unclassified Pseudomonas]|uniref:recombinase family protein n=1 Tax=unclassified Pseudomonas TaxID=196821 RepID=UPI002096E609|nr:recombinase family protein [Pseudomonas sp. 1]MCO7540103.1 recombinase family protein [Pseudomonas sp. VA159-2]